MVYNLPKIYTGDLENVSEIHKHRAKSVKISCPEKIKMEYDGEVGPDINSLQISVKQSAIKVCFMFRDLTRQYATLYAHLAEGARELSPDQVPEIGRGYQDPALRIGAASEPPPASAEPDEAEQTDAA